MIITQSKPTLNQSDALCISDVIESGQLAQGPIVKAFEAALAQTVGVQYGVATSSGTAALHLALLALEIGEGDEVIFPSYVCTALLNAVNYVRAIPVLSDSGNDFNISVDDIKRRITINTKAIIVPHMFGRPADLGALKELEIPLIEDCAQSIGATYYNQPVGSFGDIAIFSFYATKMITTGEGGMLVTKNKEIARRALDLRDYDGKPDYIVRFNYKMTEIQASIGLQQLGKLSGFITRRRDIANTYRQEFIGLGVELPPLDDYRQSAWYRFVIRVRSDLEALIDEFKKNKVICDQPVFMPLHRLLKYAPAHFPQVETDFKHALSIPIYPSLDEQGICQVCNIVQKTILKQ